MHVSVWFLCSSAVGRILGKYSIVSIVYDLVLGPSLPHQEADHVFEIFGLSCYLYQRHLKYQRRLEQLADGTWHASETVCAITRVSLRSGSSCRETLNVRHCEAILEKCFEWLSVGRASAVMRSTTRTTSQC